MTKKIIKVIKKTGGVVAGTVIGATLIEKLPASQVKTSALQGFQNISSHFGTAGTALGAGMTLHVLQDFAKLQKKRKK